LTQIGLVPSQLDRRAQRAHTTLGHFVAARILRIRAAARRLPTGRQVGLQGGQAGQNDGRKTQSLSFLQICSS
jgi:hypothetical protein